MNRSILLIYLPPIWIPIQKPVIFLWRVLTSASTNNYISGGSLWECGGVVSGFVQAGLPLFAPYTWDVVFTPKLWPSRFHGQSEVFSKYHLNWQESNCKLYLPRIQRAAKNLCAALLFSLGQVGRGWAGGGGCEMDGVLFHTHAGQESAKDLRVYTRIRGLPLVSLSFLGFPLVFN